MQKKVLTGIISSLACFIIFFSCNKDEILTDNSAWLNPSKDTIYFDTILVSLSSVTQYFTIRNPYDQPVEISRLYIAGGSQSFFRMNVDGRSGKDFSNIKIARKDSIFVFIEVTIDPLNANNPLLIKDSVVWEINSNIQDVKLMAYGQDVNLFRNVLFKTQTWTKDKPYLIVTNAAIDSSEVLTIEPGTRVYLTPNSSLLVFGTILAKGTAEEPIIFTGARFDGDFEETAGQWGTIYIHERSTGNLMEHVIIKNAVAGLQVGYPVEKCIASVELRNCMILNSAAIGIYTFKSNISAYNTVIADCGAMALLIQMGGNYNFYHCTISNISASYPGFYYSDRKGYKPRSASQPSLVFTNYYTGLDLDEDYRIVEATYPFDLNLNFYNSIVYGILGNEVYYDSLATASLNYRFDHCLLKLHSDSLYRFDTNRFSSVIFNSDPGFVNDSISEGPFDFNPGVNSPAINAGSPGLIQGIPQLIKDYNGNLRSDELPDLGAFEQQQK